MFRELEYIFHQYGCFQKPGVPQNGWFIMENPINMDDLGVPPFKETPICLNTILHFIIGCQSIFPQELCDLRRGQKTPR